MFTCVSGATAQQPLCLVTSVKQRPPNLSIDDRSPNSACTLGLLIAFYATMPACRFPSSGRRWSPPIPMACCEGKRCKTIAFVLPIAMADAIQPQFFFADCDGKRSKTDAFVLYICDDRRYTTNAFLHMTMAYETKPMLCCYCFCILRWQML